MFRIRLSGWAAVMGACLLTAPQAMAQTDAAEQLRKLQAENAQLRAQVAQLKAANTELRNQLQAARQSASQGKQTVAQIEQRAEQDRQARAKLEQQVAELRQASEQAIEAKQQVEQRRDQAYLAGYSDPDTGKRIQATRARKLNVTRGSGAEHWVWLERPADASADQPILIQVQTSFSGEAYRKAKSMTLTADGSTIELPVTEYDYQRRRVGARRARRDVSDEYVTLSLTPGQLAKLAGAKVITGQMSYVRFEFDPDLREAVRVFHRSLTER